MHPTRYYGSGDLHFITTSCYHRRPFLASPRSRDLFLQALEQMRHRYRFAVLGYVVMPEHVHLLLSEPQRQTISTVVQAIKLAFVRRILTPKKAIHPPSSSNTQHIWQARFYDFNVWTEKKRVEKLRYMHRNPVKRRLVRLPEQWRWSSFRFYLYGERGLVKINDTDILVMKFRPNVA
jgi:putative transposase